jgi:hypothetical protein
MAQNPTPNSAEQNSSELRSNPEQTESSGTAREAYMKESLRNPRFKEAPKSGKGFVIVGAKR